MDELFDDALDDSWRIDGEVVVNSSSACKNVCSLVALTASVVRTKNPDESSSLLEEMIRPKSAFMFSFLICLKISQHFSNCD